MQTRRALNLLLALAWLPLPAAVRAQGKATPTEASLREAIALYVATWNRHDVPAWAALLTDDIWYTEAIDYYQRSKGRPAVINFFGDLVKTSDLRWDITRVKLMPDGTATVVLRHHALMLPKTGDKYASAFESTPSLSRWRLEADRWRMFYFTSHKGTALAEMKKDGVE
jgi:ketosteroid isomerase-like protein